MKIRFNNSVLVGVDNHSWLVESKLLLDNFYVIVCLSARTTVSGPIAYIITFSLTAAQHVT